MSKYKYIPPLKVVARAPFKIYFEGEATSVSAFNRIGPFDILPEHADFFSILSPGDVTIFTKDNQQTKFYITNGIATVQDSQVMLFVNM